MIKTDGRPTVAWARPTDDQLAREQSSDEYERLRSAPATATSESNGRRREEYRLTFTFFADSPSDAAEAFYLVRRALRGLGSPEFAVIDARGMYGRLRRYYDTKPLVTSIESI